MSLNNNADMSVRRLRKIAEANLCAKCYITYREIIEPTVKIFVAEPLGAWGGMEHDVTQMVRKLEGVFKVEPLTDTILVSIDDDEKLPEHMSGKVDLEAFRGIGKWPFERKIKSLHKHGILKEHSYNLIDKARRIRNKLHHYDYKFTEQDLTLISQVAAIISRLHWAVMYPLHEETLETTKNYAEKIAEKLLQEL